MIGMDSILDTLQQAVSAIRDMTTQIKTTFPQVSALSTSATVGTVSFNSSQPSQFLTVITSSGGTYKTPLYLP